MAEPLSTHVRELHVRLRVPRSLEPELPHLQQQIERRVMVAVLEQLEQLLHGALGDDAVVYVRQLGLNFSLEASALGKAETAARLAGEVARDLLASIAEQPAIERLRPESAGVVVFASARHVQAARLADLADGRPAPWFRRDAPELPAVWQELGKADPSELDEVLRWLERMDRLPEVLSLAPDALLAHVAAALPARGVVVALVRARRDVASRGPALDSAAIPTELGSPQRAAGATPLRPAHAGSAVIAPTSPPPAREPDGSGSATCPERERTACAGLFYLLGRVLEIDLAEALWVAGVSEGDVLAHVTRTLQGPGADPAWRWFGGNFEGEPALPAIPRWAAAELNASVQHGLGRRLVRFGVTTTPVALGAELDRLAAEAPPVPGADPLSAAVVQRCAAALAVITAARLQQPPTLPLLHAVVRHSGELVLSDDTLRVILPVGALEVAHRRAGLDQNPGWVPWLRRRVEIEFAGVEAT